MKLTYNEILLHNQLLSAIPVRHEGRTLSRGTTAALLLMRGAYQKKVAEFDDLCRHALDDLKKDEKYASFDEKARAHADADAILARQRAHDAFDGPDEERPAAPSPDELEKANALQPEKEAYEAMLADLTDAFADIRARQLGTSTSIEVSHFTRDEFEDIIAMLGTDGTVPVPTPSGDTFDEPVVALLTAIGANLM